MTDNHQQPAGRLPAPGRTASDAMRRGIPAASLVSAGIAVEATAKPAAALKPPGAVRHRSVRADGVDVFYREAGAPDAPVLLLLHGFANSSFYFRHLMPKLADKFRLVAPDLPLFGFTKVPAERDYHYDFASLSRTVAAFVDALALTRYVLYVFDYGAPVGWDLALTYPERIAGFITQNGNAYAEGLGEKAWAPLRAYWAHPGDGPRAAIRSRMTFEGVRDAYFAGVQDPALIEPESYTLDAAILSRPGIAELQVDLKLDYKRNIERYPLYQAYFRANRPRLLAVWGRNDPFFVPSGAQAFTRDIPDAHIVLLDTGHFALETDTDPIARQIRSFF